MEQTQNRTVESKVEIRDHVNEAGQREMVTIVTTVETITTVRTFSQPASSQLPASSQPVSSHVPASRVPAIQSPASQVTARQVSASQVPASQVPANQVPASQVPASQVPASQVPASQVYADQSDFIQLPFLAPGFNAFDLEKFALGPVSSVPGASGPVSSVPGASGPVSGVPGASGPVSGVPGASGPVSGVPGAKGPMFLNDRDCVQVGSMEFPRRHVGIIYEEDIKKFTSLESATIQTAFERNVAVFRPIIGLAIARAMQGLSESKYSRLALEPSLSTRVIKHVVNSVSKEFFGQCIGFVIAELLTGEGLTDADPRYPSFKEELISENSAKIIKETIKLLAEFHPRVNWASEWPWAS
jgi:hypothetical protein